MTQELSLEKGQETVIHQGGSIVELHRDGNVTVRLGGAWVDIHADRTVEVHTDRDVEAYTNGAVRPHPAANDAALTRESKPGDKMPDGTIYAGISPDTGKAMYTTPSDAVVHRWLCAPRLTHSFKQAQRYAEKLDAHGHQDWRVPTKGELNVLFQNRAAIGGFNVTGSYPAGWYWSSAENTSNYAWDQHFSDGCQNWHYEFYDSTLRCVR